MKKEIINVLSLAILSLALISCKERRAGFFGEMPNEFLVDSLSVQKDLFRGIIIQHVENNVISIESEDCDLVPFCGVLMIRNDTLFHKLNAEDSFKPYLNLNAAKFDTLRFNYSRARSDDVVAMGKAYDPILKDTIQYFQLIPVKRMAPSGSNFIKYIALRSGYGIRYLTFSNYSNNYTVELTRHPKVVRSF